ncbi:SRPBCC family protein [Duganella vulcania]|nr:SRPBCC family protein [Duganella vulcania]
MKKLYLFAFGAAYGLLMRVVFGFAPFFHTEYMGAASGPMLTSFVVLVPLVLGIYTVYAARDDAPEYGYAILAPWAPMFAFVGGTALLLIEGSICIVMALPIFMISASLGGLLGLVLIRNVKFKSSSMNALLMLPLLSGYAETHVALPQQISQSTETIHIAARPEVVWGLINHAVDIQPAEMSGGLAYMIGVPYPIEAVTQPGAAGRVRKLRWDKDVRFDEPITAWEENRYIKWTYDFKPDSFPAGALDDHVLIGGRYFDLVDTSYRLQPEAGGTRLDIVVSYRVSTNFNWYAAWWGRVLVDDSANAILRFYKRRSERA